MGQGQRGGEGQPQHHVSSGTVPLGCPGRGGPASPPGAGDKAGGHLGGGHLQLGRAPESPGSWATRFYRRTAEELRHGATVALALPRAEGNQLPAAGASESVFFRSATHLGTCFAVA